VTGDLTPAGPDRGLGGARAASSPGVIAGGAGLDPRVVETHISVLVFLGDRVFKLRKRVQLPFLDFTDRSARELDCRREVELNSRFAPDVYLGVLDVVDGGVAVDHLVAMRRLPESRRLATLVLSGVDVGEELRGVARALVAQDQHAPRSPACDAQATRDAVRALWESSFTQVDEFVGPVLDAPREQRLRHLARSYLAGREALFAERVAHGRVRDGHGDLEAEDVFCLDDGPRILDCVEFDDRLRFGDVLSDAAFLAMDLERLGAPEEATRFLDAFREFSGDVFPRTLAQHYSAYRAYVRAKVACLADAEAIPGAAAEARRLQDLSLAFLERARVRIVLVGGLPGTGKSTLAAGLAAELGMVVLRSDEVRKELAGDEAGADAGDLPGRVDLYGEEMTGRTYETLAQRALHALRRGESVVLDATFRRDRWREFARAVARESSSEIVELRCAAPDALAARRIRDRRGRGDTLSDATPAVARAMEPTYERWPSAVAIATDRPVARVLADALELFSGEAARS